MSSVISVSVHTERARSDGNVRRRYLVTLEDNNTVQTDFVVGPITVPPSDDGTNAANAKLQALKDAELSHEDKAALWNNTQADYDRRSLGRGMLLNSTDEFYTYLPLFKAMELRSGANANQRASTLGVTIGDYNLMADRFGDVEGISFFLDNSKGQVWEQLPQEFE